MKITYDPEVDALYIALRDAPAVDGIDVEEGVSVDLDKDGHIIGVEVLDASKRLTPEELANLSYENVLMAANTTVSGAA